MLNSRRLLFNISLQEYKNSWYLWARTMKMVSVH